MAQTPEIIIEAAPPGEVGLTAVQQWQLARDFGSNPDGFRAIHGFARDHAAERIELAYQATGQQASAKAVLKAEAAYKTGLGNVLRHNNPEIAERLRETGQSLSGAKDHLRNQTDRFYANATAFSALLADYCQLYLVDTPLLLAGAPYKYSAGYLEAPCQLTGKPLLFADLPATRRRNQVERMRIPHSQYTMEDTLVKLALPAHWLTLLCRLELVAQFPAH